MASDSSAPSSSSATVQGDMMTPPNESWVPTTLTEEELEHMEARGLLPKKAISGWKCCYVQEFPSEDRTETIVRVLLAELSKLKAEKLTGATVALSFSKGLTQPIQDRVHPGYKYSGLDDPTWVKNRKVPHKEVLSRVTRIVSGEAWHKGCPKAHRLKQPTTEVRTASCRVDFVSF
ncbi:hypothetical protein C2845_PM10G11940 [Panicum miliaceum]|uniref:Uncharacterized protein n=1 Tax=Panicum miliaceum TaxID=4540 RepID=A0A3L6PEY3_PANMI|nr:hypothetical protein C2845_PM10G11940 [Panicum miliaceum]